MRAAYAAGVIELHRVEAVAVSDASLSAEERERAARYRVEPARVAFVAVRVALRRVLGERLGVPAADVPLVLDRYGRPGVPGAQLSFNVSHSGAIGLIALADGQRRLGVDVEQVRAGTDVNGLAGRFFHPAETAAIGDRRDAFFRCWTRKEAVVKALGRGLSHPLDSFAVDVDADGPRPVEGLPGMLVGGLSIDAGYAAAVAADGTLDHVWMTGFEAHESLPRAPGGQSA